VPFIRFESAPGQQMQIDWGHFGTLAYGDTLRKLYALAVIEGYSRMIYVEFTHSQNQQALHQGLLNAFAYLGGCAEQVVVDNMLTAVIERQGSLIRFNDAFLDFLRIFHITPIACNVASPHEKGYVAYCTSCVM
jgi:transposase